MIADADRHPCVSGYTMGPLDGETLYVWPLDPLVGLVVVARDGVPVSLGQSTAAALPLRDDNLAFLEEMWTAIVRTWRRPPATVQR